MPLLVVTVASILILSSKRSLGLSSTVTPGVPCYLQPSGDSCHYELKQGSEVCTSASERKRLMQGIVLVNRTLVSLEQQLIRLGIIPPDNTCSRLPSVANGGTIYSDLNLAPGTIGRYVCNPGHVLHGRQKFVCTEDGVWDGDVIEVPVSCQLLSGHCNIPEDLPNGNVMYRNGDHSNILIGDVLTYSCEEGYELAGPRERFCTRAGNWSGIQPQCNPHVETTAVVEEPSKESGHTKKLIGITVGSAVVGAVIVLVIVLLTFGLYKCIKSCVKRKTGHRTNTLEIREEGGTPYAVFQDAPSAKKQKRPSKYTTLSTSDNTTAI